MGKPKKILWISGKKFAKLIKQTPIRSKSSVEKSKCPNRMPKQTAQRDHPIRLLNETIPNRLPNEITQSDFPIRLPNQTK